MLVMIALVSELLAGSQSWITSVMIPMAIATPTAAGRPGADVIVSFPNRISAAGGRATDTPTVDTILISGDDSRRCRNSTRYRNAPSAGPARKTETTTAGS